MPYPTRRRWPAILTALLMPWTTALAAVETPLRVVTLYQGATDNAVALGITPVGIVESWLEKPMYHYLRGQLEDAEYIGLETQPNLEKTAWLKPDLIMATHSRHERLRPLLEKMAPTVITEHVFDFKSGLALLAEATGRTTRADRLLTQWSAKVADFRRKVAAELGDDWPQKASVVRFKGDHMRLYVRGFASSILRELGFSQPDAAKSQGWGMKLTSEENIPVIDADVIFVLLEPGDPATVRNYAKWRSHPLWLQLDAARHQRVHEVNTVDWLMGGGILAANAMLDDLYIHYGLEIPGEPTALPTPADAGCRAQAGLPRRPLLEEAGSC